MSRHESLAQFELFVLLALVHLGGEAFGADVGQEIERRSRRGAALGAVYSTLGRLDARGLVRHETTRPRPVRGGRGRKRFVITSAGAAELETAVRQLDRMLADIPLSLAAVHP